MLSATELKMAYRALIRADLGDHEAQATAESGVQFDGYIGSLLSRSASTTGAAVGLTAFITGLVPTSRHLDALKTEAELQFASYAKLGVASPALGPFEAFGRSFAVDPATKAIFMARYGDLAIDDFVSRIYGEIYCGKIPDGAFANLHAQVAYFTEMLSNANVPDAALAAKGAALGQLIGYAFLDADAAKHSVIDDQVSAVLTAAARGDTSIYGAELPFIPKPCAPPEFSSGGASTVRENTPAATIAYQSVATDPDGPISFALSGADQNLFSIDIATGAVRFLASPDFESPGDASANNVYDLNIVATDALGNSAAKAVTITVTDVEEDQLSDLAPPVFTSGALASIAENTPAVTIVYQAAAIDQSSPITYTLSGIDQSLFSIDAASGGVRFRTAPDFESPQDAGANNVYDISVIATDAFGNAASKAVTITVTDVNEGPPPDLAPPIFTSGAMASVPENTPAVTIVYQAAAFDPSGPIAYTLSGIDQSLFSIEGATGAVRFLAAPDFEIPQDADADNIYSLQVVATDGFGNAATRAVTITVTDAAEGPPPDLTPPVFTSSAVATMAENTPAATIAYQAAATDPSGPITYSLAGTDQNQFSIDAVTGAVRFLASPDFENPQDGDANNIYDVKVIATDGVGNAAAKTVAITVTDLAEAPSIWRVSVDSSGAQGGAASGAGTISANGLFVTFSSTANNLVADDKNAKSDIFVYDNTTKITTRVSIDSGGVEGSNDSVQPTISGDGRYITFRSTAANLVAGDANNKSDTFVHDTMTHSTIRVSLGAGGVEGNGDSTGRPAISDDGRQVAFESRATNLVTGDLAGRDDLFLRDLQTNTTIRISGIGVDSKESNQGSYTPAISADGNIVAFQSAASNLVNGDTNSSSDFFIFNRQANTIARVSLDSSGNETGAATKSHGLWLSLSADGRYVAFQSNATNLVPGDTNGVRDIFRHDNVTGETIRVNVDNAGNEANSGNLGSFFNAISANGRYVAFQSDATNLVPGDTNLSYDIFVRDIAASKTYRVSVSSDGQQALGANPATAGNADSTDPAISDDGRYVTFTSLAANLVANDTNGVRDVFVIDGLTQGWWFP